MTRHFLLTAAFFCLSLNAVAANLPVLNGSFESPDVTVTPGVTTCCSPTQYWVPNLVQDWTGQIGPAGGFGTMKPIASGTSFFINPFDGVQVTYLQNTAAISQTTASTAVGGVTYTFSVWVGKRYDNSLVPAANWRLELYDGTTYVGEACSSVFGPSGSGYCENLSSVATLNVNGGGTSDWANLAPGSWGQASVSFTAPMTGNGNLGIRIASFGVGGVNNAQAYFDMATLTDDTVSGAVPEPASLALMGTGLAALGLMRGRFARK